MKAKAYCLYCLEEVFDSYLLDTSPKKAHKLPFVCPYLIWGNGSWELTESNFLYCKIDRLHHQNVIPPEIYLNDPYFLPKKTT